MYSNEAMLVNQWRGVEDIESCMEGPQGMSCVNVTGEYILKDQLHFDPVSQIFQIKRIL